MRNKNLQTIIVFLISTIVSKLVFCMFNIPNNPIYIVICTFFLIIAIENIIKNGYLLRSKKIAIVLGIFSFLIDIAIILDNKIVFTGDVGDSYIKNVFLEFEATDLLKLVLVFIISYIVCLNIGIMIATRKINILTVNNTEKTTLKNDLLFWTIFTIITITCWSPFFLTYAPGSVLGDSTASIAQGLNYSLLNNHHPVLYSIYVGFFMRIGRAFNNYNLGVALYSFTQLIIMSGIIGYAMLWLKKKNVKLIYILLSWLYFVANSIFARYAIIMWKDPLFCSFLFLMILLLFDVVKSNGEVLKNKFTIFRFTILSLLIAFFRNNGFLIIFCIYIILLLVYRKKTLKFNIILGATIILIALIQGPVYSKLNINSPFEEAVAIPLQQIARSVAYDGKITEKQKEFINQLLPEEKFKETYEPMIVDSVKWDPEFNKNFLYENKIEFFNVWAEMLIPNFSIYVKAYLMNTFGFWSTHMQNWYGLADTYIIWDKIESNNDYNIHRVDLIEKYFGHSIEKYFKEPTYIGSGTLFWIMLLIIAILIINGKTKYIISLLPAILTWITIMISTPVAFSLRYVFVLAYALPIMIAIPAIADVDNKTE